MDAAAQPRAHSWIRTDPAHLEPGAPNCCSARPARYPAEVTRRVLSAASQQRARLSRQHTQPTASGLRPQDGGEGGAARRGGRRDWCSNGGRAAGGLRYRDGGRDADAAQQRAAIRHRAAVPRSAVRAELRAEPRQPPAAAALPGRIVPRRPPSPEEERCYGCLSFVFRRTRIRRRRRSFCASSGPCTASALCTSSPAPT